MSATLSIECSEYRASGVQHRTLKLCRLAAGSSVHMTQEKSEVGELNKPLRLYHDLSRLVGISSVHASSRCHARLMPIEMRTQTRGGGPYIIMYVIMGPLGMAKKVPKII